MTVTINFETIDNNIFKNFYDLLNTVGAFTNKIYPEFPEINLEDKGDYPIFVLNSPINPWGPHTFGKNVVEGKISFDVYATNAKDRDTYTSSTDYKIETSKTTLAGLGLKQVFSDGPPQKDMAPHGNIKVYFSSITFKYKFYFSKTYAF